MLELNPRARAVAILLTPKPASQEQVRQLFLKGTVTGEDLKEELKAVKGAVRSASTQSALAEMIGQASAQTAGAKTHNFLTDLGGRLKEFAVLLHQKAIYFSDKVLTDFLTTLTGDDGALRKESITLPSATASNMTLSQQQSVLLMAALVVGSRIAHHILDAAHKDFIGIEAEYAALLNKRKEQAALMADVLDKRRQAMAAKDELSIRHMDADLGKWLSPEDLRFIDSFGPDTSLREFANDLGMQNLAIKFLQHRDPTAYAEYRAQRSGLIGRSRAYVRTTSGVAAFGAFSIAFMQEIAKAASDKNIYEIFAVLPFAGEYAKEAGVCGCGDAATPSGATTSAVRAALERLTAEAGTNDLAVLYISTHGMERNYGKAGVTMPVFFDTNVGADPNSLLDFAELVKPAGRRISRVY